MRNQGIIVRGMLSGLVLLMTAVVGAETQHAPYPKYKPSSRAPGAEREYPYALVRISSAAGALQIGETVPDFVADTSPGGVFALANARAAGPVVIIFYRGHW